MRDPRERGRGMLGVEEERGERGGGMGFWSVDSPNEMEGEEEKEEREVSRFFFFPVSGLSFPFPLSLPLPLLPSSSVSPSLR